MAVKKNFSDIQNPCKRLSFKRSAFKSFARIHYGSEKFFKPSHCGMSADTSLGPPPLSKKFLGHCPAKRRQCLGHEPPHLAKLSESPSS
ncbi:hypothetical protein [Mitsuokella multacida]|jgi:hypothetical protein|uniref:hypothetical protein n=1 Tax=Mitsuokella multacida TaxID=52226 RepID=UPI0022E6366E|nr:hypothetical protein [Mitsuokella multacida]